MYFYLFNPVFLLKYVGSTYHNITTQPHHHQNKLKEDREITEGSTKKVENFPYVPYPGLSGHTGLLRNCNIIVFNREKKKSLRLNGSI